MTTTPARNPQRERAGQGDGRAWGARGFNDDIDLAEVLAALRRRRRLALTIVALSVLAGALLTAHQRTFNPVFQGGFKLLVSDPISQDRSTGSGTQLENLALPESASTNLGTLIQVLTSPLLLGAVERNLRLGEGALESRVSIDVAKGSGSSNGGDGVLAVTLLWPNAAEGQLILERLSDEYLAYSLRQRQEKLSQGLAFLGQQAPELQQRVNDLQNRLSSFRQLNSFVAPIEQAEVIQGRRQSLQNRLLELQRQQVRLTALSAAVRAGKLNSPEFQGGDLGGTGSNGQGKVGSLAPLIDDLTKVEKELAEARAVYTDTAPQVRELTMRRDQLWPLLQRRQLDAIESSLSLLQSEQRVIEGQLAQLSRLFTANPQQIKKYEALQQQLSVARDNLTSYIKAREAFRLQVAQRSLPWRVISPPRFGAQPVKPSLNRNLLLSLLLGGVAGVGVALLRDRLDPVFHSPSELKEALPLPVLGVVPYLPKPDEATIAAMLEAVEGVQKFEVRESLRNLFANFRLLRADKTVRLVAITSATQGEGKTMTSALFAQTLAQLGQRVLLVDADLRRPMLHQVVGVENGEGFSTLLADGSMTLPSLLQPVQTGLDLLPAGPKPPDATRLLSSERCAKVIEQIRQLPGYDLVVFDTPPALQLSDPVLLAEHLDGLLFVVGIGRVNRELPAQALQRIRSTGADTLGLLANLVVAPRTGYSDYYDYRYGYLNSVSYQDDPDRDLQTADNEAVGSRIQKIGPFGKWKTNLRRRVRQVMQWLDARP